MQRGAGFLDARRITLAGPKPAYYLVSGIAVVSEPGAAFTGLFKSVLLGSGARKYSKCPTRKTRWKLCQSNFNLRMPHNFTPLNP